MCGICGFIGLEDAALLRRMTDSIVHRGPDDSGSYCAKNVCLGHRRLSIIDLSTGHQPLSNEEGTVWIVFNGEIYNYRQLRAELELRHRFKTSSDTEVIVHLYEEDPAHFMERLDGMFSLAIYDSVKDTLTLARDPLGKKPLYYAQDERGFFFASEIKALLAAGIEREVDRSALACYLGYQYVLGTGTLFAGVQKLRPGHAMTVQDRAVRTWQYWDLAETDPAMGEREAVARLRSLLEASAKKRTIADVPVGAFLSGGIDSSAVVALTKPLVDYKFHTFAMGFPDISELPYAKMVAEHVGSEHHEIIVDERMVLGAMDAMAYHYDEPMGDAAILNNYFLSKEAGKQVKVIVAGEGGDELFAGYDNYARCLQFQRWRDRPLVGRMMLTAAKAYPGRGDLRRGRYEKEMSMLEEPDDSRRMLRSTREMSDREIAWLTGTKVGGLEDAGWYAPQMRHGLNRMLYADCRNRLPEKYLMKADKATMANSVEERLPLLDKATAEFAFGLAPSLKLHNGIEKYVLRQAVKDLLPAEIIERKKMGFSTPVSSWMRGEMGEAAVQTVGSSELIASICDADRLKKWTAQAEGKQLKRPRAYWTLYVLAIWHRKFFS